MAALSIDGFDQYGSQENFNKSSWYGNLELEDIPSKTGTHSVRVPLGANYKLIDTSSKTFIIGCHVWVTAFGNNNIFPIVIYGDSSFNTQCHIWIDSTSGGTVRVRRGTTTLASSSGSQLSTNTWVHFEVKLFINNSGTYEVKRNGTTIISGSGDTQNLGSDSIFAIGMTVGSNGDLNLDNHYILDDTGSFNNNLLTSVSVTEKHVVVLSPSVVGGTNDFSAVNATTQLSAVHSPIFIETLPAARETSTTGVQYVRYEIPNDITAIDVVQPFYAMRKTDYSTASLRFKADDGTTVFNGVTHHPPVDVTFLQDLLNADPSGNAWTIANLEATDFGVERLS